MKYSKDVFCPFGGFRYLSNITDENWTFKEGNSKELGILINYIRHTYEKLAGENKIFISEDKSYSIFNTGLFNAYYQPIYAYLVPNRRANEGKATWIVDRFGTSYDLMGNGISNYELPERANYFEEPSLLIFDTNCQINIQFEHILKDPKNVERLPDEVKNSPFLINTFTGAVQTMINQVTANYKLAVPQFYKGRIQLLLPLCLSNKKKPDVALVVTKTSDGKFYQGHTCLTMDMAYNNARLIAKPESNWLKI